MDTTDGVLMSKAYDWAFRNPLRRTFCNVATTRRARRSTIATAGPHPHVR